MKTAELTGALLDYWVARAEGIKTGFEDGECVAYGIPKGRQIKVWTGYSPSTNWAQGGPIIEAGCFVISEQAYDVGPATSSGWIAAVVVYGLENQAGWKAAKKYFAKSLLVAAMRAYVASKYGDEVEDQQ